MAKNSQLIIEAVDKASGVISGIDSKLDALGSNVGGLGTQFGVASFAGEAAFAAIGAAIDLASQAVGFFVDRLTQAGDTNQRLILTAGSLSGALGVGFDEAGVLLDQVNAKTKEIVDVLPGLTEDYQKIAASISDNLKDVATVNGQLDPAKLTDYAAELAATYGLLAGELSPEAIAKTLGRALTGNVTLAQLGNLQLFEDNQALFSALKEAVTARGVSELRELDNATRAEILREVGARFASPEVIQELSNSFNGTIESFISEFNNIFNFNKVLGGGRDASVLDAATEALNQIFELFSEISQIAYDAFGFTPDSILNAIYDTIEFFSGIVDSISRYITDPQNQADLTARLQAIGELIAAIGDHWKNLQPIVENVFETIGAMLAVVIDFADFISGLLSGNKEQAENAKARLGESINNFFSQVVENITDFFNTLKNAFTNAVNSAKNLLSSLSSTATTVNTGTSTVSNTVVSPTDTGPLSDTTSEDIAGGADTPGTGTPTDEEDLLGGTSRATGQIPSSFLMNPNRALERERAMTPGATPVIANSSEFIFTPDQMQNLITGIMGSGSFSPVINVNGNADKSTVDYLLTELDRKWNDYKSSYRSKIIKPA